MYHCMSQSILVAMSCGGTVGVGGTLLVVKGCFGRIFSITNASFWY